MWWSIFCTNTIISGYNFVLHRQYLHNCGKDEACLHKLLVYIWLLTDGSHVCSCHTMLGDRVQSELCMFNWADIASFIHCMEALVTSMTLSYMTKIPVSEIKLFTELTIERLIKERSMNFTHYVAVV